MSLELAIERNTAALNQLIEILARGQVPSTVAALEAAPAPREEPAAEAPKTKKAKKAKKEAPAGEPDAAPSAPSPAPGASDALATEAAAAATEVTYQDVAAVVTKLSASKGRSAAAAVLKAFGVDHLKHATPDRYAEILAATKAAL